VSPKTGMDGREKSHLYRDSTPYILARNESFTDYVILARSKHAGNCHFFVPAKRLIVLFAYTC
jgi:hypothetical protein